MIIIIFVKYNFSNWYLKGSFTKNINDDNDDNGAGL